MDNMVLTIVIVAVAAAIAVAIVVVVTDHAIEINFGVDFWPVPALTSKHALGPLDALRINFLDFILGLLNLNLSKVLKLFCHLGD